MHGVYGLQANERDIQTKNVAKQHMTETQGAASAMATAELTRLNTPILHRCPHSCRHKPPSTTTRVGPRNRVSLGLTVESFPSSLPTTAIVKCEPKCLRTSLTCPARRLQSSCCALHAACTATCCCQPCPAAAYTRPAQGLPAHAQGLPKACHWSAAGPLPAAAMCCGRHASASLEPAPPKP